MKTDIPISRQNTGQLCFCCFMQGLLDTIKNWLVYILNVYILRNYCIYSKRRTLFFVNITILKSFQTKEFFFFSYSWKVYFFVTALLELYLHKYFMYSNMLSSTFSFPNWPFSAVVLFLETETFRIKINPL